MYVCLCAAVTDRAIEHAARQGIRTLDELSAELGVGAGCGCCRELAAELLSQAQQPQPCFEPCELRRLPTACSSCDAAPAVA